MFNVLYVYYCNNYCGLIHENNNINFWIYVNAFYYLIKQIYGYYPVLIYFF